MTDDLPVYAPTTHAERVAAHLNGTPQGWQPYTPDTADVLRDGLLRGWRQHMERKR